jgi:hypothetical protein
MSDPTSPSSARRPHRAGRLATAAIAAASRSLAVAESSAASSTPRSPFIGPLHAVSTIASTVPANGDVLTVNGGDGILVETAPDGM